MIFFFAHVITGDEVVILEPAFDIYLPQVQMAGGVTRFVPLRPTTDEDGSSTYNTWFPCPYTLVSKVLTV